MPHGTRKIARVVYWTGLLNRGTQVPHVRIMHLPLVPRSVVNWGMGYTRAQRAAYMTTFRENRRAWARKQLGGACKKCGATEDLEFDHIDPSTKIKAIASMLTESWEAFVGEVAKCQLLCKEHHQEKSKAAYSRGNWTHGKTTMYRRGGCRCDLCVLGQAARRRAEPARQGKQEIGISGAL